MELEMDIEDLLNKRKIESDRIEFKAGWNPRFFPEPVWYMGSSFL